MIRVSAGHFSNSAQNFATYDEHARIFGCKSAGLGAVPAAWRPHYISISCDMHDLWRQGQSIVDPVFEIDNWIEAHRSEAVSGFIVRSSGLDESLQDRGRFISLRIDRNAVSRNVAEAAERIFRHAADRGDDTSLGVVVQMFMDPDGAGHLSNEVRLSPTRNQWQYEVHVPTWLGSKGLNSKFAPRPDPSQPLRSVSPLPHATLRSVGSWATESLAPRAHIEWVVSRGCLWVVQVDLEWAEIDHGVDPTKPMDVRAVRAPDFSAARVFFPHDVGSETKWKKLRNLDDFDFSTESAAPRLYVANGSAVGAAMQSSDALAAEIDALTGCRAVVRMEIAAKGGPAFNLPRTETVNGATAVKWLARQLAVYRDKIPSLDDLAFILHAFLPAHAGVWAYADPNQRIAFVDALWGLPDGLQVLPHDSYQIDVGRKVISSVKHRYKPRYLQETNSGQWEYIDVLRSKSRASTLAARDAVEIGIRTAAIANKLGRRAQIMWFSGVPEEFGVGRNLPWFRARETVDPAPREAPRYRPVKVASFDDLNNLPQQPVTIRLDPEAELIRREDFLDALIEVALARKLPVEIQGSTLSHTFYRLFQAGVVVNPPSYASYYRSRGRQTFGKLVRDKIPDQIRSGGEIVIEGRLAQDDFNMALLGKLFEEALEFKVAQTPSATREELSDLLEVLRSLAKASDINWQNLVEAADIKAEKRGSFAERRVLLETSLAQPNDIENVPTDIRLHELDSPRQSGSETVFFPFSSLVGSATSQLLKIDNQTLGLLVRLEGRGIFVSVRDRSEDTGLTRQLDLFDP